MSLPPMDDAVAEARDRFGIPEPGGREEAEPEERVPVKWEPRRLSMRHEQMCRLYFAGWKVIRIAEEIGVTPDHVSHVVNSAIARAYLAELRKAVEGELPKRIVDRMEQVYADAVATAYGLMRSPAVNPRVRLRAAQRFMDGHEKRVGETQAKQTFADVLAELGRLRERPTMAVQVNEGGTVVIGPPAKEGRHGRREAAAIGAQPAHPDRVPQHGGQRE